MNGNKSGFDAIMAVFFAIAIALILLAGFARWSFTPLQAVVLTLDGYLLGTYTKGG